MDFYIDGATGSDSNPGTVSQPFATLPAANAASRARLASVRNDTIRNWIAAGLYETPELYLGEGVHPDACQVSWRGGFENAGDTQTISAIDGDALHTRLYGAPTSPLGVLAQIRRAGVLVIPEIPFARPTETYARLDVDARAEIQAGDVVRAVQPNVRINGTGAINTIGLSGKGCVWNYDPAGGAPIPGGANGGAFEALTFQGTIFAQGAYGAQFYQCVFEGADHNFRGGSFYTVNCLVRSGLGILLYGGAQNGHDQAGCRNRETTIHGGVDAPQMECLFANCGGFGVGFDGGDSAGSGAQWVQERNLSFYSTANSLRIKGPNSMFRTQKAANVRNRLLAIQGDENANMVKVLEGGRLFCIPSRYTVANLAANDVTWDGAPGGGKTWGEVDASAAPFRGETFGTLITKDWQ